MVRSFLDALTQPRDTSQLPIEMYAHDPSRYVGEMLAWLHQAIVSEGDMLQRLVCGP